MVVADVEDARNNPDAAGSGASVCLSVPTQAEITRICIMIISMKKGVIKIRYKLTKCCIHNATVFKYP